MEWWLAAVGSMGRRGNWWLAVVGVVINSDNIGDHRWIEW